MMNRLFFALLSRTVDTLLTTMKNPTMAAALLLALFPIAQVSAGCFSPLTDAEIFVGSLAVAKIEVISSTPFETPTGSIRTRLTLRALETLKGKLPQTFEIESPGGAIDGRVDLQSDSLNLPVGASATLYLQRDTDGNWSGVPREIVQPSSTFAPGIPSGPNLAPTTIPGSVVTSTGYTEDNGQPSRFTRADGALPIHYLIDIDPANLPTGLNQAGAIAAVADAFAAWAGSSSLRFAFDGVVSFGTAANDIIISDERLRIQLHDNYNKITNGGGTLGIGGGSFTAASIFQGGKVASQGFQERLSGFVILENPVNATSLNDIPTFKRVLTHEIGHALGLAHSSENASEPDSILKAATMYYQTGPGSAGATIQTYDVDRIQFGYPATNTPPYAIDRIIPAITAYTPASLPAVLGVNRIQLRALDLQGTALTPTLTENLSGNFSLAGSILVYTPAAAYSDSRLTDVEIEEGYAYDRVTIQFSDGVNLSRGTNCIVIGYSLDTTPADGLPDSWMIANFNTKVVGALGSGRNPTDDPDHDGLNNRTEFYLNTNPNSAASGQVHPTYDFSSRQLSVTPLRFAPYAVESSTNLAPGSWTLRRITTDYSVPISQKIDLSDGLQPAREFYRLATGP